MAESKAAKKNKKRRAAVKKPNASSNASAGFEIVEDVSMVTPPTQATPVVPAPLPLLDPIAELKRQIEEAKASKDHVKTQELRHKIWVLQDMVALGKAGPGAPKVDIQDVLPGKVKDHQQPVDVMATAAATSSSSADPTGKKLNRLRKKLGQIEALKLKLEKGEKLEETQITKIKTEPGILEEISLLEGLLAGVQ